MKFYLIFIFGCFVLSGTKADGKEDKRTYESIEISEFVPLAGKRCNFIGTFQLDSLDGKHDDKAKEQAQNKVGKYKFGGEPPNFLLKIGTESRKKGFPPGSTMTHHYAAYYCYIPLSS